MTERVMVELRVSGRMDTDDILAQMSGLGLAVDPEMEPVPMGGQGGGASAPTSVIVNGTVEDAAAIEALRRYFRTILILDTATR